MRIGLGGGIGLLGVGVLALFLGKTVQKRGVRELQGGIRALQDGDLTTAFTQLEFADHHLTEREEPYLAQMVRLELGYVAEQKGDLASARRHYEEGAELEGPLQPEALLAAARVLALLKEDEASLGYYKKFLDQYPNSPMGQIVREKVEGK
jgi:tetratricopeptide (TPR) repeat protein